MKVTAHEEYGLRCLIRLGQAGPGGRHTIPELIGNDGLSEAYVGKLLRLLRLGGFVTASRGVGGYSLARPASRILLRDVMAVLGERLYGDDFCETHVGERKTCVRNADCSLRVLWHTLQLAVDDVLKRTTLEHLLCSERQMTAWVRTLGTTPGQMSRQ